jgi:limonene-1,2-epoxide hydrolase
MTTPNERHKVLFKTFVSAFLNKDLAQVAQCLAPHFEWRLPSGETYTGKENALAFMAKRFADPNGPEFSDSSSFTFHGATVIQSDSVKAMGANGQRQVVAGLDVYQVEGGLIVRKDAYWKQLR